MYSSTLTVALTLIAPLCAAYHQPRDGAVSIASLPPCAVTCAIATSQGSKCSNPTDLACSCTDADFQGKMFACMQKGCDSAGIATALSVSQQLCAGHTLPTPPAAAPAPTTPNPSPPAPVAPTEPKNATDAPAPAPVATPASNLTQVDGTNTTAPAANVTFPEGYTCTPIPVAPVIATPNVTGDTSNTTVTTPNITDSSVPSSNATDAESTDNASSLIGGVSATLVAVAFYVAISIPNIC